MTEQIDREEWRAAALRQLGLVAPDPRWPGRVLQLLGALEQAEAERDTYRAKMNELDRAYLSEHGQRKRIEGRVRDVRDVLDQRPQDRASGLYTDISDVLDGEQP